MRHTRVSNGKNNISQTTGRIAAQLLLATNTTIILRKFKENICGFTENRLLLQGKNIKS